MLDDTLEKLAQKVKNDEVLMNKLNDLCLFYMHDANINPIVLKRILCVSICTLVVEEHLILKLKE